LLSKLSNENENCQGNPSSFGFRISLVSAREKIIVKFSVANVVTTVDEMRRYEIYDKLDLKMDSYNMKVVNFGSS
jgi:hypothetical protein